MRRCPLLLSALIFLLLCSCARSPAESETSSYPGYTDPVVLTPAPSEPAGPAEKPTEPTDNPTEPTEKPSEPMEKPTKPTQKPTEPAEKPIEPTDNPTEPTEKPSEPMEKPAEPTQKPTEPTQKPTEPAEKPAELAEKPTGPAEKPTEPAEKPTKPVEKPANPTENPTTPPSVTQDEAEALAGSPAAVPVIAVTEASGIREKRTADAVIDYSNTADGYVMVQYTSPTAKRLKAQVKGPTTTYTYNLTPGKWETFPLSDGNGSYQVAVYQNVSGTKYAAVTSVRFEAGLNNEFAPHLLPNQYVNYTASSKAVAEAARLTHGETDALKKVELVYDFVVSTLKYDKKRAATVQSGYLPDLDAVLAEKKGICFDYAALMAGMLRSQNVPCKLVVGYAGTVYHAWISVWSEKTGWVDGAIFFDGTTWQRMDPTFASSANRSDSIMQFIGDGKNYTEKYIY